MKVEAPRVLAGDGQIGMLLVSVAADPVALLAPMDAIELALPEGLQQVASGQSIEISVLISSDDGLTFDELDETLLAEEPMRLFVDGIQPLDSEIPTFYAHPTYIASDPLTGIVPLAEPGEWAPHTTLTLGPYADDPTGLITMEARLRTLSTFIPTVGTVTDPGDTNDGTGDGTGDEADDDADGDDSDAGGDSTGTGGTTGDGTGDAGADGSGDGSTSTSGGEAEGPCTSADVFVDFAYEGHELGTELKPYNTIDEATQAVMVGGTIWIRPGGSNEAFVDPFVKPLFLKVWDEPSRQPGDNVQIGDVFSCGPDADSFSYPGFESTIGLTLSGDTHTLANDNIELVPAGAFTAGAVWTTEKKLVVRGFDTTFVFTLDPGGVDETGLAENAGIALVIQNASATPALSTDGGIGYDGIVNSVAIEYDAHITENVNDPPGQDHISVHTLGTSANSSHHGGDPDAVLGIAELGGPLDTGFIRSGRVVYDASAKTLKAYLDNVLKLTIPNFDLDAILDLDEGRAWMGITAANGIREDNGNSLLHVWVTTVPQSCGENVFWEQALGWDDLGYQGDQYDHRLTGDVVQEGDIIEESLVYVSDNVGYTQAEISGITLTANGKWEVVADTRHGITGLWRGRIDPNAPESEFDDHNLDINNDSVQDFFDNQGGTVATAVFGQIMKIEGTQTVVGRHRITFKLIKIDPETTEGGSGCYSTGVRAHVITKKDRAFNPAIWPFADTVPPVLPCPP